MSFNTKFPDVSNFLVTNKHGLIVDSHRKIPIFVTSPKPKEVVQDQAIAVEDIYNTITLDTFGSNPANSVTKAEYSPFNVSDYIKK